MFISGLLLALTVLLLLWKLPRLHKSALDHPALSDITITLAVVALGLISLTFSGLMVGIIAGICLSAYFGIAPKLRNIGSKERVINALPRMAKRQPKIRFEDLNTLEEMEAYLALRSKKPMTYKQALKEIKGE
jgi:MFS superfamily sulfate permease-like transporter